MKGSFSVKTLVAVGIGAAVFVVLGRFAVIPTPIPNTVISTQYAFLSLMAMVFGPLAGTLIAFIGHTLIDLTGYGTPWWSWIIASTVCGFIMGLLMKRLNVNSGEFGKKEIISFNIAQVAAHAVSWLLIAPGLDVLIYAEPAAKVFIAQGIGSFLANAVTTGVIGTILALAYAKTRTKKGSLTRE